MACKLCWLVLYGSGGNNGIEGGSDKDGGSKVGWDNEWAKKTDPTLNLVSNLYSKLNVASL